MANQLSQGEDTALYLTIGTQSTGCLILRPLRREYPQATDYWDGNWLITDLLLSVGGFEARVQATLVASDFSLFLAELEALQAQPTGTATFTTMEEWLQLTIVGNGRGHFQGEGRLVDEPGMGNELRFRLEFDQTSLPAMVHSLGEICKRFPVIGDPAV